MLTVRRDQVRAFGAESRERFTADMLRHLRTHFAAELESLDDQTLSKHIDHGLERAAEYGLTSRRDCARYLGLAACFGWSFDDEQGWAAPLLSDATCSPSERIARAQDRGIRDLEHQAHKATLQRKLGL